jgi:SAM-dependent methyltransferase
MKCNVCDNEFPQFNSRQGADGEYSLYCPLCNSEERHRALVSRFSKKWEKNNLRMLDVGPFPPLMKYFLKQFEGKANVSYIPADIKPLTNGMIQLDIQEDHFTIAPCDLILATHVLEYVRYEYKAMQVIYNSLKEGGELIFDADLKEGNSDRGEDEGEISEAPARVKTGTLLDVPKQYRGKILTEDIRAVRFGDRLRYRKFGKHDVKEFLESFTLKAKIITVDANEELGLSKSHQFVLAEK